MTSYSTYLTLPQNIRSADLRYLSRLLVGKTEEQRMDADVAFAEAWASNADGETFLMRETESTLRLGMLEASWKRKWDTIQGTTHYILLWLPSKWAGRRQVVDREVRPHEELALLMDCAVAFPKEKRPIGRIL
jgi:hypothetical protein